MQPRKCSTTTHRVVPDILLVAPWDVHGRMLQLSLGRGFVSESQSASLASLVNSPAELGRLQVTLRLFVPMPQVAEHCTGAKSQRMSLKQSQRLKHKKNNHMSYQADPACTSWVLATASPSIMPGSLLN